MFTYSLLPFLCIERVVMACPACRGLPLLNGFIKAIPMRSPESLRNDHIEIFAEDFFGGIAENCFGAPIPYPDRAATISVDHGIRCLLDDRLKQVEGFTFDPRQLIACLISPICLRDCGMVSSE